MSDSDVVEANSSGARTRCIPPITHYLNPRRLINSLHLFNLNHLTCRFCQLNLIAIYSTFRPGEWKMVSDYYDMVILRLVWTPASLHKWNSQYCMILELLAQNKEKQMSILIGCLFMKEIRIIILYLIWVWSIWCYFGLKFHKYIFSKKTSPLQLLIQNKHGNFKFKIKIFDSAFRNLCWTIFA